jgi:hypothetical protein
MTTNGIPLKTKVCGDGTGKKKKVKWDKDWTCIQREKLDAWKSIEVAVVVEAYLLSSEAPLVGTSA